MLTQHTDERCLSCLEAVETPEGVIDLDVNGLCDSCRERQQMACVKTADLAQDNPWQDQFYEQGKK